MSKEHFDARASLSGGAGHWPQEVSWVKTPSSVALHGKVPSDLFHLAGHFQGNPVVPGFVAVSWALGALERALGRSIVVHSMRKLKFLRALRPSDGFVLRMELGESSSRRGQAAFALFEEAATPQSQEVPFCSGVFVYD